MCLNFLKPFTPKKDDKPTKTQDVTEREKKKKKINREKSLHRKKNNKTTGFEKTE